MTKIHVLLAATMLVATSPATAASAIDAANDFLPSFTGPAGADLDVRASEVFLRQGVFNFTASLGGEIGTTAGGFYVFGLDRGQGTARFGALASNVLFDSVVVINNTGTGFVRDLLSGVMTTLDSSAIAFDGASLSAFVDAALLPGAGFDTAAFTYNLWPRSGAGGIETIADFAPDNANNAVTAVPEPATWALMIGGFGLIGISARRRRPVRTAA